MLDPAPIQLLGHVCIVVVNQFHALPPTGLQFFTHSFNGIDIPVKSKQYTSAFELFKDRYRLSSSTKATPKLTISPP